MDEEILDLVNENDEIIGEVLRSIAHSDPKNLHREIAICLYDKNRRLLLQRRSLEKKSNPGKWALTAGHVGKGLSPEDVAHTELIEELGFDVKLNFFCKLRHKSEKEDRFFYVYTGEYGGEKVVLQKDEVMDFKLVTQTELDEMEKENIVVTGAVEFCKMFFKTI